MRKRTNVAISVIAAWVAVNVSIVGCTLGKRGFCEFLHGTHWRMTRVPMEGGPVSYSVTLRFEPSADTNLTAEVVIHGDHPQQLFVFDPSAIDSGFHPAIIRRERETISVYVGSPGLREDGLLRLVRLQPGEQHSMELLLGTHIDMRKIQDVRLGLLFLPDPDGSFARDFGALEERGFTWYTEVGSTMWCKYMSHLVYDEITIPIRTNIHVCD